MTRNNRIDTVSAWKDPFLSTTICRICVATQHGHIVGTRMSCDWYYLILNKFNHCKIWLSGCEYARINKSHKVYTHSHTHTHTHTLVSFEAFGNMAANEAARLRCGKDLFGDNISSTVNFFDRRALLGFPTPTEEDDAGSNGSKRPAADWLLWCWCWWWWGSIIGSSGGKTGHFTRVLERSMSRLTTASSSSRDSFSSFSVSRFLSSRSLVFSAALICRWECSPSNVMCVENISNYGQGQVRITSDKNSQ